MLVSLSSILSPGVFVLLTINTESNTPDTTPLPAAGALWKYKAIYRLYDELVGQWSDVISVLVGM